MAIEDFLINSAPNWVGFIVGIVLIWKIATNALHGIADSNKEIALTQSQMVTILKGIGEGLEKQTEILVRLEERTR